MLSTRGWPFSHSELPRWVDGFEHDMQEVSMFGCWLNMSGMLARSVTADSSFSSGPAVRCPLSNIIFTLESAAKQRAKIQIAGAGFRCLEAGALRSGELHLNAAGLITQGFAVAVKVVASGTLLNLIWLCTKASQTFSGLLRNLLLNPVERDLQALHQSLPDLLRNLRNRLRNLVEPDPAPAPVHTGAILG